MERGKFSQERLMHIRRLRRARMLYKKVPLFAYQQLSTEYPGYTVEEFWEDLKPRRRPTPKTKKDTGMRYGRYAEIGRLLSDYQRTGNIKDLITANSLQARLRKPYRLQVIRQHEVFECSISPLVPIQRVRQLREMLAASSSIDEARKVYESFRKSVHLN